MTSFDVHTLACMHTHAYIHMCTLAQIYIYIQNYSKLNKWIKVPEQFYCRNAWYLSVLLGPDKVMIERYIVVIFL